MTLTKLALYTSIRAAPSSTLPNSTHYSHNRRIMGTSSSSSISLPSSSYAQPLPSVRSSPRFIDRSETFRRPMRFSVEIFLSLVTVMAHPTSDEPNPSIVSLVALNQISVVPTYAVHLSIDHPSITPRLEDMADIEWLQLLSQFPSVRTLFVPKKIAGHISSALEDSVGVMVHAEVLPALEMLFLEGQPESSVHKFLAARRDAGHSVTFVNTDSGMEFEETTVRQYEIEVP
ncbi:hypothetical protein EI94DRAFT_866126 [Lactarius quietus]|nr:hypothetical protein EI94DRAFT_866126 [Lactarius quietus]